MALFPSSYESSTQQIHSSLRSKHSKALFPFFAENYFYICLFYRLIILWSICCCLYYDSTTEISMMIRLFCMVNLGLEYWYKLDEYYPVWKLSQFTAYAFTEWIDRINILSLQCNVAWRETLLLIFFINKSNRIVNNFNVLLDIVLNHNKPNNETINFYIIVMLEELILLKIIYVSNWIYCRTNLTNHE